MEENEKLVSEILELRKSLENEYSSYYWTGYSVKDYDFWIPSQAVNQAISLNVLSADLYTDSKRFIYELLQNDDDSSLNNEGVKGWIKIGGKHLVVAHSGKSFSSRGLSG